MKENMANPERGGSEPKERQTVRKRIGGIREKLAELARGQGARAEKKEGRAKQSENFAKALAIAGGLEALLRRTEEKPESPEAERILEAAENYIAVNDAVDKLFTIDHTSVFGGNSNYPPPHLGGDDWVTAKVTFERLWRDMTVLQEKADYQLRRVSSEAGIPLPEIEW